MTIESHIADGTMRIVIFSADGHSINVGNGALFHIPVTMINGSAAGASFTLSNVLVADAQAHMVAVDVRTDALKATATPSSFALGTNSPNPFNPATTISYEVPAPAHITLTVYNLLGQEVVRLVNTDLAPGRYSVVWNGANASGSIVASGVYLYRLTGSTGYSETKRMLLLK
ncbi:MAG: T9SS type A sorting domain-containing protein [Candidatus Latescibacteria bacterium]|nr:T9SS type A sorting domain-containing protein [Candidatus Latescibacterota bacterium]